MTRLAHIQSFIEASRSVRSPRALEALIDSICREMGFDYFALIHHVDLHSYETGLAHMEAGSFVAVSSYPETWVEEYVRRGIVADDPVLLASQQTNVGFQWDEIPRLIDVTARHRNVREDTERAGIGGGYTVPAHVPGDAAGSCSFAMRLGRSVPQDNLPMAQLVGSFAFQSARAMVLGARGHSGRAPKRLTDRQLECTMLVGRGLTEREIASRLGIAEETVKRHLKEARLTHGVRKSVQLVARALHEGQITLADILKG